MDQSGEGCKECDFISSFHGPCLLVPLLRMAPFSEVKRWIALFVHLIEVEQGSRQDRRPGLTGMEGLVEAGVGVIGVVPI